jgi:hypothetical protein
MLSLTCESEELFTFCFLSSSFILRPIAFENNLYNICFKMPTVPVLKKHKKETKKGVVALAFILISRHILIS